jgi:microcin C transport system substrate-binding protein
MGGLARWDLGRIIGQRMALGTSLAMVGAAVALTLATPVNAQDQKRTAISLAAPPKYEAGFKSFDWVNPDAPKGGRIRFFFKPGSFDSFNLFPAQGSPDVGVAFLHLHSPLFASSPDESSAEYGQVAEWISYPPDFSSATFGLRAGARFHDGKPMMPEDVVFSFDTLKVSSPTYSGYYKNIIKAEKTGTNEVKFTFDVTGNRELPQIISQLPVLPKHWWQSKNDKGEPRDIAKSSLELPLGSGPYKIKSFEAGSKVVFERVKDWWGAELPVNKGQWNFDEVEILYFRERTAAFETFKRGDVEYWAEASAKSWATEFDFEALKRGIVKKEVVPIARVAPMQGFVMNQRRKVFQDVRVRRAITLAFDFDWANKNLFYDQYVRLKSYFDNSELASRGLPEGRELEILNEVRADLPPEVFATEWKNPTNATPEDVRRNLGAAVKLLAEAGYTNRNGTLVDAAGQPLAMEILLDDPGFDRIVQPFKQSLEKIGIKVTTRQVDSAQYETRTQSFDYDIIVGSLPQSESPGNEQRDYFSSISVDVKGSRNSIGVKNKAIDVIIEKLIFAKDRPELIAATRALDRALLWNFYLVPQWHLPASRIAYWDRFGRPAKTPSGDVSFLQTWWVDPAKDAALAAARGK